MVRWKFKSCPRCGGDLFIDREVDGLYEQCLQCGYLHPLPSEVAVRNSHEPKEESVIVA